MAASRKKRTNSKPARRSAHEIARAIRKPSAPPSRPQRPAGSYDRSRRKREIDEAMEETP